MPNAARSCKKAAYSPIAFSSETPECILLTNIPLRQLLCTEIQ